MHSCIRISYLNPYRCAFYCFMPNQSVDQSFNSKWQVSFFNQFPKYCYLRLLLPFHALSFRLITCIFSVCMFIEFAVSKSNWHDRLSACSPFTFSKKAITKKFFVKPSATFSKVVDTSFIFCKPSVTFSKVTDQKLYFSANLRLLFQK